MSVFVLCGSYQKRKSHEDEGNITQEESLAYVTVSLCYILAVTNCVVSVVTLHHSQ